ncbi:MAG TPA: PQQ-dependent sugar dehydrogenase [Chthoniobacterales bacterium]|jgi:glucose/arabinose dehydrogenase
MSIRFLTFLAAILWFIPLASGAENSWPLLRLAEIAQLSSPTHITHAGDGSQRLFIVSQNGGIYIYKGSALLPAPFLDITQRVASVGEQGIFSIAFPPGYSVTKNYFYVAYSRAPDGAVVLSRFNVPGSTPNLADAASESVLLVVPHSNDHHYGGQLAFGPDGYLYLSLGDGGPQGDPENNAQNPNSLLGKLLRLDTESGTAPYAIPPSNPFVGVTGYRPEIWALGLRNPWRFSFDRLSGDLYLTDVGSYEWEEVNFLVGGSPGGQNYGWNIMEGGHPHSVPVGYDTSTLTLPVIEYGRSLGSSVTGGFVYRGPQSGLTGLYVYGDFMSGNLFGARRENNQWVSQQLVNTTSWIGTFGLSTFGEDETGRLYLANYLTGRVYAVSETIKMPAPVFTPPAGPQENDVAVSLSVSVPESTVHYTTNGTYPQHPGDPAWERPIHIQTDTTFHAAAYHPSRPPSESVSARYTFKCALPTFLVTNEQSAVRIFISSRTQHARLHYTLDGSLPTEQSPEYRESFLLSTPTTVRAIAFRAGYAASEVINEIVSDIPTEPPPTPPTPSQYIISSRPNRPSKGTTAGSGTYIQGSVTTVRARAKRGFRFVGWMENGRVVSRRASYVFPATRPRNLVAHFR